MHDRTPEHYINDATYHRLVEALLHPKPSLCPASDIREVLGEIANIWPASIAQDTTNLGLEPQ